MRHRTVALLAGAATATAAAAIGAATATLYRQLADEQHHRALMALSRAFLAMPSYQDAPAAPEPGRHLRPVR